MVSVHFQLPSSHVNTHPAQVSAAFSPTAFGCLCGGALGPLVATVHRALWLLLGRAQTAWAPAVALAWLTHRQSVPKGGWSPNTAPRVTIRVETKNHTLQAQWESGFAAGRDRHHFNLTFKACWKRCDARTGGPGFPSLCLLIWKIDTYTDSCSVCLVTQQMLPAIRAGAESHLALGVCITGRWNQKQSRDSEPGPLMWAPQQQLHHHTRCAPLQMGLRILEEDKFKGCPHPSSRTQMPSLPKQAGCSGPVSLPGH